MQHVEQDYNIPRSGDELPTYDELAVQGGPNSRFGRWRGWIEKRAAERYNDIGPDERDRRRQRGWGNDDMDHYTQPPNVAQEFISHSHNYSEVSIPSFSDLSISTYSHNPFYPPSDAPGLPSPPPAIPSVKQKLRPSHLQMNNFGSRFLPHSTSQIHCILPLLSGKLILFGHDEGLSVLDLYPQEITESGAASFKGPDDAQARLLWTGESVFQMTLLEEEDGSFSNNGVVLCLVGPQPESPTVSSKESEAARSVRMYKLSSLTSLAKWAVSQKGQPLDLHKLSNHTVQQNQSPPKRHKAQGSIARGLKALIDSPGGSGGHQSPDRGRLSSSSYQALLSPSPSVSSPGGRSSSRNGKSPARVDSTDSWDMIDDLPLRWATDFVPLATSNSRLLHASVLTYSLWNGDDPKSRQRRKLLAVATKGSIFLYETPKGERAFRFVKEFYTPLQPRSITFFQQSVTETTRPDVDSRSSRHHGHHRSDSQTGLRSPEPIANQGIQLGLFVIFDKKAGWIRLSDSAVGELEFYDDGSASQAGVTIHYREPSVGGANLNGTLRKRGNTNTIDVPSSYGKWIPLIEIDLPLPSTRSHPANSKPVYVATRGKQSQILPCPLPTSSAPCLPIHVINWRNSPSSITVRVLTPLSPDDGIESYLQLINLGEHGVEVQELLLSSIGTGSGKGKGKASADDVLWADADAGGDAGYLCHGGHWDHPLFSPLHGGGVDRSMSMSSMMSGYSTTSTEMSQLRTRDQGLYAWCRKGLQDWRIFWLGGTLRDDYYDDDDGTFE